MVEKFETSIKSSKFDQLVNDPDAYFARAWEEAYKIVDKPIERENQAKKQSQKNLRQKLSHVFKR